MINLEKGKLHKLIEGARKKTVTTKVTKEKCKQNENTVDYSSSLDLFKSVFRRQEWLELSGRVGA